MSKTILISIPDELEPRLRAAIPDGQRSKTIVRLLEQEILQYENSLYQCALKIEKDKDLNKEMSDWDITLGDGLDEGNDWE